jgi:hypothetical protein
LECIVKKPLAALALAAATIATLAVPAGAAVPKTKPTWTVPCTTRSQNPTTGAETTHYEKGHASVWVLVGTGGPMTAVGSAPTGDGLAATNPCSHWLSIYGGNGAGHDDNWSLLLHPGAHFNWPKKVAVPTDDGWNGAGMSQWTAHDTPCNDGSYVNVTLVYSYKHDAYLPNCPGFTG